MTATGLLTIETGSGPGWRVAEVRPQIPRDCRTDDSHAELDVERRSASNHKAAALEALRVRHDRECPHCATATYHTNTVFGEADPNARIMFIGEAPGEDED